jgi:hypothetical protein
MAGFSCLVLRAKMVLIEGYSATSSTTGSYDHFNVLHRRMPILEILVGLILSVCRILLLLRWLLRWWLL